MTAAALRLVVFDVDGTLLDSAALIAATMAAAFAAEGRAAPDPRAVVRGIGLELSVLAARLAPDADAAEVARLVAHYRKAFLAARAAGGGEGASALFPGARAALERLHADPPTLLGIATGKGRGGLDHLLAAHDLGRFFVTAQSGSEHPGKPHPAMLEAALEMAGVPARRAVMVGDTTFDMEMARHAGVLGLGVGWGSHAAEELRDAGAAAVISSFDEIDAALAALV